MSGKAWVNAWTAVEALGGNRYGATIFTKPQVFKDSANQQWTTHKVTDNRATTGSVTLQSANCCVEVYPFYAVYFDVHHESVRVEEERWVVQYLFQEPDTWRDIDLYAPVVTVTELDDRIIVTIAAQSDYGPLVLTYLQRDGYDLKHEVQFTNTEGTTRTFRVLQRWSGIAGTKCNNRDIPSNSNIEEDAPVFAFHEASKTAREYAVRENLWKMVYEDEEDPVTGALVKKTDQCLRLPLLIERGPQGVRTDFIYGNWVLAADDSLLIDPATATLNDPTVDGYIREDQADPVWTSDTFKWGSAGSNWCRAAIEWNVETIPDSSTITDTILQYHGAVGTDADPSIIKSMNVQPSVSTRTQIYDAIAAGTSYIAAWNHELGENKSSDLGTDADSDLHDQLASDWFAIGIYSPSHESDGQGSDIYAEEYASVNPAPTLYVEYTAGASQTRSVDHTVSSAWNNPDNAFSENDTCTDTDGDANQNVYDITVTPFTIPTGATIDGIEVKTIRGGDADDYYTIELYDSTSAWRSKTGTAYSAGCADGAQETLGGAADTWSGTWTAAHINSSSFQVRLTYTKTGKASTFYVDHIEVVVYYTAAGPTAYYQTVTDLAGLVDSIAKTWTGHKTVADQTGLLDSVIAAQGIKVVVGDLAGLLDTIELSLGYKLTSSDIAGLLDTVATLKAQFHAVTDPIGLTDSAATVHLGHLSIADLAGLLDSIALKHHITLTVADISGFLDSIALIQAIVHRVTDLVGLVDAVALVWAGHLTVNDIVSLSDSISTVYTSGGGGGDSSHYYYWRDHPGPPDPMTVDLLRGIRGVLAALRE